MTSAFPVLYALGYGRLKGYTMSMVMISCGAVLCELLVWLKDVTPMSVTWAAEGIHNEQCVSPVVLF
jgi:hypothetical protein